MMTKEGKIERLRVLEARINKSVKDIGSLDMAGLSPWWLALEQKALAINEDLRILLPLAAEVQPLMVEAIISLKEAVVNMRIDSYNRMNDATQSIAAGKPIHQEPEVCESMKAHGIDDPHSHRGIKFCLNECPYQSRCLTITPAGGEP